LELEKKIASIQPSTLARQPNKDANHKGAKKPTITTAKRTQDTPLRSWVSTKPAAAKDMKPSLCAFVGICDNSDCKFEHDIEKVPAESRDEVDVWLTKRPPTSGLRQKNKKAKVQT
jgi:hypothetical protein